MGRERIWQEILPPDNGTKHSCLSEIYFILVITLKKLLIFKKHPIEKLYATFVYYQFPPKVFLIWRLFF